MISDTLLRNLEAQRVGSSWMAKCPAHDDHSPSLSIRYARGKPLLHCHAGCSQGDVIEALRLRGIWESLAVTTERPRIVATYDYRDETGELLYQTVRYDPKDFKQRYPDRCGGWIWKKGPRQVLYHLKEVLEAPIVFLVEGERDVETLREHGFVASTSAGGSDAPQLPEFTDFLTGREVILIPDNDEPGRMRALKIAQALISNVLKLVVLELDGAAIDVTEWFQQGHSEVELIALVEGTAVVQ